MQHDRMTGLKRIRMVASIVGAAMFGFTGAQQFAAADPDFILPGVVISAAMGFGLVFIVMTIVIHVLNALKKGD